MTKVFRLALIAALAFAWGCGEDEGNSDPVELGKLQGTVVDAEGAALAGAVVATTPATTTATTGADGKYLLEDLTAGTYSVTVTKEGFLPATRSGIAVADEAVVTLDFSLVAEGAATGSIAGTVTDDEGNGVAGATVVTDPPTATATTAADGTYAIADVEPGTYTVTASHDGFEPLAGVEVTVVAGEAATANFELLPVALVGSADITVTGCDASPLAGAILTRDGAASLTADAAGVAHLADVAPGDYTFTVSARAMLPGTVTVTVAAGETATASVELVCQWRAVAQLAREYLAGYTATFGPTMGAQALFNNINDGDTSNDPTIISVRANADYQNGHIPGAINHPWKTVANDDTLAALGTPDPTKKHVVYCYTGHTGAIASGVLGTLGYVNQNLKYGIVSWTSDPTVRGTNMVHFDPAVDCIDAATETTAHTLPADQEPPELAFDVTTAREAAIQAARAYFNRPGMAPTMTAAQLNTLLTDADPANDPLVVSVRSAEHYALGHIPGAINIPYKEIANEEQLKKLPKDRKIVIYCYTGHTGGIATGILGMLGYDVVNLKWGINAWTQDMNVVKVPQIQPNELFDYTTTAGPNP